MILETVAISFLTRLISTIVAIPDHQASAGCVLLRVKPDLVNLYPRRRPNRAPSLAPDSQLPAQLPI